VYSEMSGLNQWAFFFWHIWWTSQC